MSNPYRLATKGMTPERRQAWFREHAADVPSGWGACDLGPKLPCDTLASGRHNAGRKRRRGPTEYAQHNLNGGRQDIPIREYYHQGHATRGFGG